MKKLKHLLLFLLLSGVVFAQDNDWFYATMEAHIAQNLKSEHPEMIEVISESRDLAAVYVNKEVASHLHNCGNRHGSGYIFKKDRASAISSINSLPKINLNVLDFTITEDEFVTQCIGEVNEQNIANTIMQLEEYGTRFHTTSTGVQASIDIKEMWQNLVTQAERSDITVELFNHDFTNQKSVILTIPGTENPEDIVIIGGHLDSGDQSLIIVAPGADDNASGIAVLTETLRILLANNFRPSKTVQIMGYAAEEIGLYGSADIADTYKTANKNVLAVAQFDMTNYNGSSFDIALIDDSNLGYTSDDLNLYLIELMEHYNATGNHVITYGSSECGYGCSDHASWSEQGYLASFPFEADFDDINPFIHTTQDTFANMGSNATHSVKFVKLALEFVIEIAKSGTMATQEFSNANLSIVVKDKNLIYNIKNLNSKIQSLNILDVGARKVVSKTNLDASGTVSLQQLPKGFYIAVFKDINGKTFTKKFLVK
ncbi:M20/M25/M40 family metallo-hydrolase [Moheibacter sediminis]|uniref:Leucyl aminopeptidase n=1 Tax=Moheibacter sediminis TaxID=1434700 RepID=A0A1W1YAJ3_9FLAO|nr:M20/M25/M40 family metallo-hydrolase [Moheibacter sediminis]SMC32768.1 leucyl aminopeptidase [Moheibacter sediminis]